MDSLQGLIGHPYSVPVALCVGVAVFLIKTVLFKLYNSSKEGVEDVSNEVFDKIVGKKLDAAEEASDAVIEAADETAEMLLRELSLSQLGGGLTDDHPDPTPASDPDFVIMPSRTGSVLVRLLPKRMIGNPEFVESRTHRINGKSLRCLGKGNCPVCEYHAQLWIDMEKVKPKLPAHMENKHEAQGLKATSRWFYNCIEVGAAKEGDWTVKVLSVGRSVHETIMNTVVGVAQEPKRSCDCEGKHDYDCEEAGKEAVETVWIVKPHPHLFDLSRGRNLRIVKEVMGPYPTYSRSHFEPEESPICDDPKMADKIMRTMPCLSQIIYDDTPTSEELHRELSKHRGYANFEAYQKDRGEEAEKGLMEALTEVTIKVERTAGIEPPISSDSYARKASTDEAEKDHLETARKIREEKVAARKKQYPVDSFIIVNNKIAMTEESEVVGWVPDEMDDMRGKFYKVEGHDCDGYPCVNGWNLHTDWIQTVEEKYPVGIYVIVKGKGEGQEETDLSGVNFTWRDEITEMGCFKVEEHSRDSCPRTNGWTFHPDWIQTVEERFPVGELVRVCKKENREDSSFVNWDEYMDGLYGQVEKVYRHVEGLPQVRDYVGNPWTMHPDWIEPWPKEKQIEALKEEWPIGTRFMYNGQKISSVTGHDPDGWPTSEFTIHNPSGMTKTDKRTIKEKFSVSTLVQIVKPPCEEDEDHIINEFVGCRFRVESHVDPDHADGKVILASFEFPVSGDAIKFVSNLTLAEKYPVGHCVRIDHNLDKKDGVNNTPDMLPMMGTIQKISAIEKGPCSGVECIRLEGDDHFWHPAWVSRVGTTEPRSWNELGYDVGRKVTPLCDPARTFKVGDLVYWITKKGTCSYRPSRVYDVKIDTNGDKQLLLAYSLSDEWKSFWVNHRKCSFVDNEKLVSTQINSPPKLELGRAGYFDLMV